jgi:hypothetical protein
MANAWGSGSYGVGEFGTGLQNVTLVLDGQAMSATSGNLGTSTEVNLGWGRLMGYCRRCFSYRYRC